MQLIKVFPIFLALLITFSTQIGNSQPYVQWWHSYGTSNYEDHGYCLQITSDGGYIIAGSMFGSGRLIKTDSGGWIEWAKYYSNGDYFISMQKTTDGGYILVGSSFNSGSSNVWIVKTDNSGNASWDRQYGGTDMDVARSVLQTPNGEYIVAATTRSYGSVDDNIWILKINSTGQLTDHNIIDIGSYDAANCIKPTSDGNFIIAGSSTWDPLILKINTSLDTIWTKKFNSGDRFNHVLETSDNGFILVGSTLSGIYLVKTDSVGNTLWEKTFNSAIGPERGYCIQITPDNGYIIVGSSPDSASGEYDAWLIRTDESGNEIWTLKYGGAEDDAGRSIRQNADGSFIVAGNTHSFGPSSDSEIWWFKTSPDPTGIRNNLIISTGIVLYQNFPNPANPSTTIEFDLPKSSNVTLKIFNILGEEVATLVSDRLSTGSYSYEWDARSLASGVYLYRLEADGFVQTRKMILMR